MPFQKGKSGNPNGRPKRGTSISDIIRAKGEANNAEMYEKLSAVIWARALAGDTSFVAMILDRMEGKALERVQLNKTKSKVEIK